MNNLTPHDILIGAAAIAALITLALIIARIRRPKFEVLVHRGFFVRPADLKEGEPGPPEGAQWLVKIYNRSAKPVIISHIGWRTGDDYVPVLARRLPLRIAAGGVAETWLAEGAIDIHSEDQVARGFEVRDTNCRLYFGRFNTTVAPAGFVA